MLLRVSGLLEVKLGDPSASSTAKSCQRTGERRVLALRGGGFVEVGDVAHIEDGVLFAVNDSIVHHFKIIGMIR